MLKDCIIKHLWVVTGQDQQEVSQASSHYFVDRMLFVDLWEFLDVSSLYDEPSIGTYLCIQPMLQYLHCLSGVFSLLLVFLDYILREAHYAALYTQLISFG